MHRCFQFLRAVQRISEVTITRGWNSSGQAYAATLSLAFAAHAHSKAVSALYLISVRIAEMCLGPWPRFKFNTPLRERKSSSPYGVFQFTFRHPVTLPGRPLCRVYRRVVLQHVPFGWFRALSRRRLSSGTEVTRMTRVSDTASRTFLSLSLTLFLSFLSCR